MTNVFGEGLDYEIDTDDVLNEVDAKIKMMNIANEKKFVNVSGDVIESLQIKNNPVNDLDVINLKYLTEKINEVITKFKQEMQNSINEQEKKLKLEIVGQIIIIENKLTMQEKNFKSDIEKNKNVIEKIKSENVKQTESIDKIKSDIEKIKSENVKQTDSIEKIKSDIEKNKSENEKILTQLKSGIAKQTECIEKIKKEINNVIMVLENKFNLLNKNITKWHGTVENRLKNKKAV